jgi:hypothetical protein
VTRFVDLSRVETFSIAAAAARAVETFFQEKAAKEEEAAVLLGAAPTDERGLKVDLVFVPEQEATAFDVKLHPDALKKVSRELPQLGRMFVMQMHTHPGPAFHSSTDNADTTFQQHGGLSIVVPAFGAGGLRDQTGWAVFRRNREVWCGPLPADVVAKLVVVEGRS